MVKTWRIRTKGKIEFLIIYLITLFLACLAFSMYTTNTEGGTIVENLSVLLIVFSPVMLVLTIAPTYWILKKKIPQYITANNEKNEITFHLSKRKSVVVGTDLLGYSLHNYDLYSVLIFYKKADASRPGYWFYKELIDIVAPRLTFSWNIQTLKEISNELENFGVKKIDKENKKFFLMRIIG